MKALRRLPAAMQIALVNVVLAVATFVTGIILARALGAENRGIYGALFLWALTAANIFAWGNQMTLARDAAQRPHELRGIYRSAYLLSVLGGAAGAAIFFAVVATLTSGDPDYPLWLVAVASLIVPFTIPNAFQIQIELGRSRFSAYNLIRALFVVGNCVTAAALWLCGVRSVGLFVAVLATMGLWASVTAALAIRPSLRGLEPGQPPSLVGTIRRSTPIALTMLVAGVGQQSDKLFASALFEPKAIGLYLVAATLAQVQSMVGEALAQMYFARGAALDSIESADREWLSRRLRQTILIYLVVCLGGLVVLPPLLPMIYGREFAAAGPLLTLLLPGLALQGMNRPFEEFLRGLNLTAALFRMGAVLIVVVAVFAIAARAAGSIELLPWGVICGFAITLAIAAHTLARGVGTSMFTLLAPRWSDVHDLWRTFVVRTLRGHRHD